MDICCMVTRHLIMHSNAALLRTCGMHALWQRTVADTFNLHVGLRVVLGSKVSTAETFFSG
jgi:hypothetical protein